MHIFHCGESLTQSSDRRLRDEVGLSQVRNLPNRHLNWSFARDSEDTIVQKSNIRDFCPKSIALNLISLKTVQLDELVEAPDSY